MSQKDNKIENKTESQQKPNSGDETINQKIDKLNQSVEWFYSDEFRLEEASDNYQQVMRLAKDIEEDLKALKNKIEVIDKDFTKE